MTRPADRQLLRWSTDDAPEGERLGYWVDAICAGFLEMEATSRDARGFASHLTSAALGELGLNHVDGHQQSVYRTTRAIARSRENYFYLLSNRSAWRAVQGGREALLAPGDCVLVDSRRPYEFHFPEGPQTTSLELPVAWVERWLPGADERVAQRIDGSHGWGRALAAFAPQLTPELALAPPLPAALLADQLGALLALAVQPPTEAGVVAEDLPSRVRTMLRQRLAEPGLTAADVALALSISERSLHRHLARAGLTFASLLMGQRMAEARRMVESERCRRLTLAEIGRRVGLLDASHFVRVYKRHHGVTPGAQRGR